MIEDKVRAKITALIARAPAIVNAPVHSRNEAYFAAGRAWIVEALNVVELAVPKPDNAYRRHISTFAQTGSIIDRVGTVAEMLQSLLVDVDGGLLGDLGNKVRAETFDEFLDHALEYRKEGRQNEAGVIAGVVFEDTIRKIYADKIGDHKGQQLEDIINALAKNDVITGQQSKQAKVAAHVRTKATHAQWDEFDLAGVDATIDITKTLLRDHMGG